MKHSFNDVARRHIFYGAAVVSVVVLARTTVWLTCVLSAILVVAQKDSGADVRFLAASGIGFPLVEAVAVNGSRNTWSYVHPLPVLGVPEWLFPLWGLASIWIVDVHRLCKGMCGATITLDEYKSLSVR